MISLYYRRHWLQVLSVFLKTSIFSLGSVALGLLGYVVFHILMRRPPSHEVDVLLTGVLLITLVGSCAFSALTLKICSKRPPNDPFRYSPYFEKYFSFEGDKSTLVGRLNEASFQIILLPTNSGMIRATLTKHYEGREKGEKEATSQLRKVVIEAQLDHNRWIGRIYSAPLPWYAFLDGADLARIAVEEAGNKLKLHIRSNPSN